MVNREDGLPENAVASVERNALLNALRHDGKAEVGAVISKVIGDYPELRTSAKVVARAVEERVREVNVMTVENQRALLRERYPDADIAPREREEGRIGLPPLPNVKGALAFRLPPEPSGFMHIGHGMAFTINSVYAERYNGKLWLRFEDTNPRKVEPRYYESFREGSRWLGIKWDYEKSVSSDLEILYEYGQKLLSEGNAYACGCDEAKVKKLRFSGTACEHRGQSFEKNLEIWNRMISKKYGEGEYVIRLRGEMKSPDYSLRDPNIFRVIEHPHPLTGSRYSVWPTYDFEVVVEDELCKITHVLRSSEFHLDLQELIRTFLSFQPVTVLQFSRFNFKGTPVSKRLLRPLVEKKLVGGWDDPRMPTIEGVKRRGILPESIKQFTLQVGYTKTEHEYDWSLLFAVNRKLLDPLSKRLMFVPDPIALHVKDAPSKEARIPYHPEKNLGSRTIETSGFFFVPKRDALGMKAGTVVRLIEQYNIQILGKKTNLITAQFHSAEVIQDIPKIQWVTDLKTKLNVLELGPLYNEDGSVNRKSLVTTKGLVEESFRDLSLGQIIQFIRYGFCRVDSRDTCVLAHK